MMWSTFKKIIIFLGAFIFLCFYPGYTQNKYEKNIERYKTFWNRLIPSHTKIQFAGSMGLISIGPGWDYGKKQKWESDILIGFVPKYSSSKAKMTFTFKQNFIPWNKKISNYFSFNPLTTSIYLNSVLNNKFWNKNPERYPKGYYTFSTKIRINLSLGQRLSFNIQEAQRKKIKAFSIFYELGTNDIYLISKLNNKYRKAKDYLGVSFGIKIQIL